MVALRQGGEVRLPGLLPSGLAMGPGALGSALRPQTFLLGSLSSELRALTFLLRSLGAELRPVSAFLSGLSFLAWALGGNAQRVEL